jgi:hypothetical protein
MHSSTRQRAPALILLINITSLIVLVTCLLAGATGLAPANAASGAAPGISNVSAVATSVALYEKFEVQFDVSTVATQLDLPYDPAPPAGLRAGTGISVDAQFSRDNWATLITQPAFLLQPYTRSLQEGREHFTPSGAPRWATRFAPQQAGTWQYRLRAQDAGGTTLYPASGSLSFTASGQSANPYLRHGFLRVGQHDKRYFEFQDGTPFVGVGYNGSIETLAGAGQLLQQYEQYKMNFFRVWMSMSGINGSQWSSWGWPDQGFDGYLPEVRFDTANTFNGADVSTVLDGSNVCYFGDFWQNGIPAEPNTTYAISARVKLSGVSGPASGSGSYGFAVKKGDWPDNTASCQGGTRITPYATGTTGWITLTGSYTTHAGEYWLNYLYLARDNTSAGTVYIDDVRVWRENDPAKVNLLREPNANSHLYFDPMNGALWDRVLDTAAARGVYLKIVTDEKNEWIRNHIGADGHMTADGSNDNFYAAAGTKARWLAQAWWRYLIARWGYSTAVHSFEYVNEGDPYNTNHYDVTNSMARYFRQNDPARHMVSTSLWHSFPGAEFWANPAYQDVDYADLHAYVSTGWGRYASFIDPARVETRAQYVHGGNASLHVAGSDHADYPITPRGVTVRGPGEWIVRYWAKASNITADCSSGTGGSQRVRWQIDGGRESIVPAGPGGADVVCSSPGGTYDWTQFRSDRDRNGNTLPQNMRLVLADTVPHEISLRIENWNGAGGDAWIDDVELVSPSGQVVPVIGQFDMTPMDEDTAWYNRAYGDLFGACSPGGASKPLVRGETGMDTPEQQEYVRDVNLDTQGIWLHNNVWGQVNPGGMYDLFWWARETIDQNPDAGHYTHIYTNYLTYRNFMEGIPINNGLYVDAGAQTSNASLRAWGQRDDTNGRMHLWVQNTQHTWKRVVYGPGVPAVTGVITLPNMASGTYQVTWWDTYRVANPAYLTQTLTSSGKLVLTLPAALATDVAVKIQRVAGQGPPLLHKAFLPCVVSSEAARTVRR